ncbi:hypothetical protein DXV75_05555 [Alteromonas aestuariivivens]|uniref:Glycoside hydrolase family 42 N-terminal domain-containing protein n=1 Tax=Alteromonas aestuariivivens TaxID=1938339 RepID=A0A3D8MAU4_9ALTE|nr:beta-galactosidase [Alteromonas aestuariivivens]RDV27494.1 hypothetical protein DXV75_05555 [Alteromonas aestuariivivens]
MLNKNLLSNRFIKKAVLTASAAAAMTFTSFGTLAVNEQMKPLTGLYALDCNRGQFRDDCVSDHDFVDGYAWRISWQEMEPQQDKYDFSGLDHIVKLLNERNQKLSLIIMPDLPDYLAKTPGMDTYIYENQAVPSPWDPKLMERYTKFVNALAMHKMPDPKKGNRMVPYRYHSVNAVLHPTFPGTPRGGMRNEGIQIKDIPGYSRSKLIDQHVDQVVSLFRNTFRKQALFFSLWPINDSDRSYRLYDALNDKFAEYDNVGIWMDNLAASRACTNCEPYTGYPQETWATHMTNVSGKLMTGFQMLGSWEKPFNVNHVPKVANGSPMDGMDYAMKAFDSQYFEVYTWDLERKDWQAGLKQFQEILHK